MVHIYHTNRRSLKSDLNLQGMTEGIVWPNKRESLQSKEPWQKYLFYSIHSRANLVKQVIRNKKHLLHNKQINQNFKAQKSVLREKSILTRKTTRSLSRKIELDHRLLAWMSLWDVLRCQISQSMIVYPHRQLQLSLVWIHITSNKEILTIVPYRLQARRVVAEHVSIKRLTQY